MILFWRSRVGGIQYPWTAPPPTVIPSPRALHSTSVWRILHAPSACVMRYRLTTRRRLNGALTLRSSHQYYNGTRRRNPTRLHPNVNSQHPNKLVYTSHPTGVPLGMYPLKIWYSPFSYLYIINTYIYIYSIYICEGYVRQYIVLPTLYCRSIWYFIT